MAAVTDYIQTPDAIVQATVARLEAVESLPDGTDDPGWRVETFHGTSYRDLFAALPGLALPAAVVILQGADINRTPGRPQRIYHNLTVLVLARHADLEEGATDARGLLWAVLALLDEYQSGDATWRATGADAVDLSEAQVAPGVACYAVQFEVGDH